MRRDVEQRTNHASVVAGVHVDLRSRELDFLQGLLHLRVHFAHQLVEVRHLLSVVYGGRRSRLVEVLHAIYPSRDFLWLFIGAFDAINIHGSRSHHIFALDVLQLKHRFVFAIESRLVELNDTQVFLLAVWFWHLQECINLAHSWHIVGNEGLQFGVKIDFLGFITLDIFKELLHIAGYLQIRVVIWVVGSWNNFIVVIVFIVAAFLLTAHVFGCLAYCLASS